MRGPHLTLTAARPVSAAARLVSDRVASRISAGSGWAAAPRTSRPLVGHIAALHEQFRVAGLRRVVVATTGGAGVAAETLTGSDGSDGPLIVLDTTDPDRVADVLTGDLAVTLLVVSVPPGEDGTGPELVWDETERALRADGLPPARHTVLVCPPEHPLLGRAEAAGATVVPGDPHVDGPWCALTAYALVPAGLAGTDVATLLADAAAARDALAVDEPDNPALVLGTLLGQDGATLALRGPGAEWAAQLVAAGLGKDGRGPLPVVTGGADDPWPGRDTAAVRVGPGGDVEPEGPLGARIGLWQHAVAAAAHLLGVDPLARPDARAAAAARSPAEPDGPPPVDGCVEVWPGPGLPNGTVSEALRGLVAALDGRDGGHLAVHAYLDPAEDASAAVLRAELARRTGLPTSFGWAPRCLAGAGQLAKGGAAHTAVLQLTGAPADGDTAASPLAVHQLAQARADAAALAERGRPVLRLHLTDRLAGLVTVARAVESVPDSPDHDPVDEDSR